ncbi:LysM peptidoglycan-binding domain-containing protein [Sulfuriroseicoccus oceanibius]|uniref:LysM peptidoglycan-binding domain-containing protein n=1 Tax=Sulfuriroseicoccus oceanibius TaxID=2707525 RepID=A0A6B3L4S9_9BACT|nr:LysM peptidoglycan-binding domain-containing protein [Sulfuriroseicoccus oceanibius]QQL44699.1 LysM peptidoglycan-binding domain-containing protein [Sulfuriroseicoccus oceanibius]
MSRTYTQRTRKAPARRGRETGLLKLEAKTKKTHRLSATATEEHDWGSDVPSIKLSTAFFVILALHVALVTGVMVFKRYGGAVEGEGAVVVDAKEQVQSGSSSASSGAASQVETVPAPAPRSVDHIPHSVRPYETLDSIAQEYSVSVAAIRELNGIGIDQPLQRGAQLMIPRREIRAVSPKEAPVTKPVVAEEKPAAVSQPERQVEVRRPKPVSRRPQAVASKSNATKSHTVSKGETLWAISQRYGVTPDQIMKANGIKDARFLRAGAVIKIPQS